MLWQWYYKVYVRRGKSGRGSLSSNVELQTNLVANFLILSDEDEINSLLLMTVRTYTLLLLRILFEIFENSRESNLLFSTFGLTTLCVTALWVFLNSLATNADNYEFRVMQHRSQIKFSMPKNDPFGNERDCSGGSIFKECRERSLLSNIEWKLFQSALGRFMKRDIGRYLQLSIDFENGLTCPREVIFLRIIRQDRRW